MISPPIKRIFIKENTYQTIRIRFWWWMMNDERLLLFLFECSNSFFKWNIRFRLSSKGWDTCNNNGKREKKNRQILYSFSDLNFRLWNPKTVFLINFKCFWIKIMHFSSITFLVRFSFLSLNYFGNIWAIYLGKSLSQVSIEWCVCVWEWWVGRENAFDVAIKFPALFFFICSYPIFKHLLI